MIRQRVRNINGQLGAIEYTILEQPRPPEPKPKKPERENPAQLNIKGSSKDTGPSTLYVYPRPERHGGQCVPQPSGGALADQRKGAAL